MQLLTPPHFYADSALPSRRKLGHLSGYNFRFRVAIGRYVALSLNAKNFTTDLYELLFFLSTVALNSIIHRQ